MRRPSAYLRLIQKGFFSPRSNGVLRACPCRSGLPALALAAASRQILHTALALSLCTPRRGCRSTHADIQTIIFSMQRCHTMNGILC